VTAVDVVELAQRLIRVPSPNPPGDEQAVASVVQDVLGELGLPRATLIALAPHRPNLLVTVDLGPGGRHLVLSGHMDTKPVGDAPWTVDPWAADIDGDRLYGLGSADMKAAIAAMLLTAARVASSGVGRGRLSVLLTADEEDGAAYGAHHVASTAGLTADGVVIGEPGGLNADFDRLHLVSRGIARLRLIATGRQGHSSLSGEPGTRNAGVDAARAAVAVADGLKLVTPPNTDRLQGWEPTANTGMAFRGGVGYGVLPGVMAVDTEVRLLPGMRREEVEAGFDRVVRELPARTGANLRVEFDASPNDWLPPTSVAATHPLALAAAAAHEAVLGTVPPLSVFPGTTDATWFATTAGIPTLPAVGPGLLRRCHGADEWVSVAAVRKSVELYTELGTTFCGGGADDAVTADAGSAREPS
jgi:acetylornithine deacetylase/succinyl-diaminopimelate desuccinylase-like protein